MTRRELLAARAERQARIDAGELPDFLPETREIREGDWRVAPVPADLRTAASRSPGRSTGRWSSTRSTRARAASWPTSRTRTRPTWRNNLDGQANLIDAIERTIELDTGEKTYRLNGDDPATLLVRPRGWHLPERHVLVDGEEVSGSLFDFGLYLFHNGRRLLDKGQRPYLYLPKLESHLEARLWNDVFDFAGGRARPAARLDQGHRPHRDDPGRLRDGGDPLRAARPLGRAQRRPLGLHLQHHQEVPGAPEFVLPDRAQVTMTVPFMRAYTELLVKTCHRRGAHAMGGMAAFVPSRRDPEVNEVALAKVRDDKRREAGDGFDGTWVAHPDLVPVALEEFDEVLGTRPNQVERLREEVDVAAADLLDVHVPEGEITDEGVRMNVSVGLRYLESWLRGTGAVAIYNLMEDAATAEISRSQIWQWLRHGRIERDRVVALEDAELAEAGEGRWDDARALFDEVALSEELDEFLTLPAYELID